MAVPSTLHQQLVDTLPPGFVLSMLSGLTSVYQDAYSAMTNHPALDEEQGQYVLGHYRRGLCETLLKRVAAEFGLFVDVVKPDAGGCSHIQISNNTFKFSMCHVQTTGGFPAHSDNREQSSQINSYVPQREMFPIEVVPSDKKLYGIFVHTEQPGRKAEFQSVCIGFPNTNFSDWIYQPIDLRDIRDDQIRNFQEKEDLRAVIQDNEPKFKDAALRQTAEQNKKD